MYVAGAKKGHTMNVCDHELRVKPKPRARSALNSRSYPESKANAEIECREGSWKRVRWAPPEKTFKNSYLKPSNLVQAKIFAFPSGGSWNLPRMNTDQISIPAIFSYAYMSLRALETTQWGLERSPSYQQFWCILTKCIVCVWIAFFEINAWYGPNIN